MRLYILMLYQIPLVVVLLLNMKVLTAGLNFIFLHQLILIVLGISLSSRINLISYCLLLETFQILYPINSLVVFTYKILFLVASEFSFFFLDRPACLHRPSIFHFICKMPLSLGSIFVSLVINI